MQMDRRVVMAAGLASGAALAAPVLAADPRLRFKVPDGACDCHHHLYDPRFAYMPDARLKPPFATVADYRKLQKKIGTSRNVIVQPSTYGTDNRCVVDALHQMGDGARTVCVVNSKVSDGELKDLNAAGVRGVRVQFGLGNPVAADEVMPLARRIADMVASVPDDTRRTCSTGSIRATISSASSTSPCPGVPKEVPRATAAWTASVTTGWACPRIIGPQEHTRSTYSRPSASVRYGPEPDTMNRGVPPTARKARTGEFTPPGVTAAARSKRVCETGASNGYRLTQTCSQRAPVFRRGRSEGIGSWTPEPDIGAGRFIIRSRTRI